MVVRPRCVFLAGPSSAGKTSLARAFQRIADEPWFFFEGDLFSGGFPRDRSEFVTLEWDRRVREACARAAVGILKAGLGVIVELGFFDPWGRANVATIFSGLPAFIVRVHCDPAVLEAREQARGDRFQGTARRQCKQLEGIPSDFDLVSDAFPPEQLAEELASWLASDPVPRAIPHLAAGSPRGSQ
ncbi:MAG: phosphotransferase-like protein [Acidimicrobiales bacterium]